MQLFTTNAAAALRIALGRLEAEVAPLATDRETLAGDLTRSLLAAIAAFLATAQRTLPMRQSLLASALVARTLLHPALGIGQAYVQAHVPAHGRMLARRLLRMRGALLLLRSGLADKPRIPGIVGARLGSGSSGPSS
jgi:hypothetical protein